MNVPALVSAPLIHSPITPGCVICGFAGRDVRLFADAAPIPSGGSFAQSSPGMSPASDALPPGRPHDEMRRKRRMGVDGPIATPGLRGAIVDFDEPQFRRAHMRIRGKEAP